MIKILPGNKVVINGDIYKTLNESDEFKNLSLKNIVDDDEYTLEDLFNILNSMYLLENIADSRSRITEWVCDSISKGYGMSGILHEIESCDAEYFTIDYTLGSMQSVVAITTKQQLYNLVRSDDDE